MVTRRYILSVPSVGLLMTVMLAGLSLAATIHVPADQPTIQAGVDAASAGDTVLVAPGTYVGSGNTDIDFGGTDRVLLSEAGPLHTVIDTQGAGRGIVFGNGETSASIIGGFTIRNAAMPGRLGGAILCSSSSPTIRDCEFSDNVANAGGGIYCVGNSSITASGCTFVRNSGLNGGGGIYVDGGSLACMDCLFSENSAARGGGVYQSRATSSFTGCSFQSNEGINRGGGIYSEASSSLSGSDCDFEENHAPQGGGIYSIDSSLALESCDFTMNDAPRGGGVYVETGPNFTASDCTWTGNTGIAMTPAGPLGGAGVFSDHCAVSLSRCRFTGNTTESRTGYGPAGGGMLVRFGSAAEFVECTFEGNSSHNPLFPAGASAGGLSCSSESSMLTDCEFTGNTASGGVGGCAVRAATLTRCTVSGNRAGSLGVEGRGGGIAASGGLTLRECRVSENQATGLGGGVSAQTEFGVVDIADCAFVGNTGLGGGGLYIQKGIRQTGDGDVVSRVTRCSFDGNSAGLGGGIYVLYEAGVTIESSVLTRNSAVLGGGICFRDSTLSARVVSSTLVGNSASEGGNGVSLIDTCIVSIENVIIAFGAGAGAAFCDDEGSFATVACTDIVGNEGGDWTGCISDQFGINGNFSADPLFCNVGAGDYTLAETSPCAPEHSPAGCGLIGAYAVACVSPIGVAETPVPPVLGEFLRVTPNPIGPGSVIEWVSVKAAPVSLRLYDPLGRLVTSRSLRLVPGGRQELRWGGLVGERRLAPGVYLLELGGPAGGMGRARVIVIR
jgi:predicted outer membrane repeat protein